MGAYWSNPVKSKTPLHTGLISKTGHKDGNGLSWSYHRLSPASPRSESDNLQSSTLKKFSFKELKTATQNFRADNVLGKGDFGEVFKGWIDEHSLKPTQSGTGMAIAVKKLKRYPQSHQKVMAEIYYVGQLHHPNLVKLIGYCLEDERRLLVYEFVHRGSMEHHLFKRSGHFQSLSWTLRMRVALGAAKGLDFLHSDEVRVAYSRDLKICNILLNEDYDAKLSDFGLSRDQDDYPDYTEVITNAYAAPEWIKGGRATAKSDIYGFGVILLEILSGRRATDCNRPIDKRILVEWAKPYLGKKRQISHVLDPYVEGQYSVDHALKVSGIALQCLSNEPELRPNICEVVKELETLQGFTGDHGEEQ